MFLEPFRIIPHTVISETLPPHPALLLLETATLGSFGVIFLNHRLMLVLLDLPIYLFLLAFLQHIISFTQKREKFIQIQRKAKMMIARLFSNKTIFSQTVWPSSDTLRESNFTLFTKYLISNPQWLKVFSLYKSVFTPSSPHPPNTC